MPSVTVWTRIEPRAREDDIRVGLQARIADPLWLLGRQWQLGEFQGEDAGSPVVTRLEADSFGLTRYLPKPLPAAPPSAVGQRLPAAVPLETLVEREPIVRGSGAVNLRVAADAGQYFRRLLIGAGLATTYYARYVAAFAFLPRAADADVATAQFLAVHTGRSIDGARLFAALNLGNFPSSGLPGLPADPTVPQTDHDAAVIVAQQWLAWYRTLLSEPSDATTPWLPERMEYEFAVSAASPGGELVLNAAEYVEGHLDWFDFTLRPGASLASPAQEARFEDIRQATIPAPVSYPGMPASRWWEFEDRQIEFGAIDVAPQDLVSLVMVEFALIYGNDWFIVPIDLAVGSLTRLRGLTVIDSFGTSTVVPPFTPPTAAAGAWQAFSLSVDRRNPPLPTAAVPRGWLFLPPVVPSLLESQPVEELWLLRDEMANLAWGVERIIESRAGERVDRRDLYYAKRIDPPPPGDVPSYRLASEVPDYWVPLVPVGQPTGGIRLQRGQLARAVASGGISHAQGRILGIPGPLLLFDEEVPRSGTRVTSTYQYARWSDGSTHVWRGRRKEPGRGEGSSGLRYDTTT